MRDPPRRPFRASNAFVGRVEPKQRARPDPAAPRPPRARVHAAPALRATPRSWSGDAMTCAYPASEDSLPGGAPAWIATRDRIWDEIN
jgi:hypothetical protein